MDMRRESAIPVSRYIRMRIHAVVYRKGKRMTRDKKRVPRRSNIDNDDETVFPQASSTAMSAA